MIAINKHQILFLIFSFFLLPYTFGQRMVEATMNINTFHIPNEKSYVEISLNIEGGGLEYNENSNNNYQAEIEITQILKQGENIIDFNKYKLKSIEYKDSSAFVQNMIDLQRFQIPENGKYAVELKIQDLVSLNSLEHEEFFEVNFSKDKIEISDVTILSKVEKTENKNIFSKNGYDLIPAVSHYLPSHVKDLKFYFEVYNADEILNKDAFLINYYVENAQNFRKVEQLNKFSRKESDKVVPYLGTLNINNLYSGNYNLVIELKNRENEVVAEKKVFFQRNNKNVEYDDRQLEKVDVDYSFVSEYNDIDSLRFFIDCLYPISSRLEEQYAKNQIRTGDKELMKRYLYKFWFDRDPLNPREAWYEYYAKVLKTNKFYNSTIKKGYRTDRGRVYLMYGPPNTITQQYNEPSSYPYEIWHYYNIGNFNNKRFVFYDRNLTLDDFELLHSDLYGEVNNPRWRIELQQRTNQIMDLDQENVNNKNYGSDVDDFFLMPR